MDIIKMKAWKLSIITILFILLASIAVARPINELPMYGGEHDPTVERNPAFSRDATKLGWKYFYKGELDTAIKRFNQGWMFDRENPEVYWGFGLIMGKRATQESPEINLNESIRFLKIATEKAPQDSRIMSDLAFSNTILGYFYKSQKSNKKLAKIHFDKAESLFNKAYKIDPNYPPIIGQWSFLHFYSGDYKKAKNKAEKAISMGYEYSPAYLKDLNNKLR
jgi:tetratricopeptide (TPR) repeat protein